MKKLFFLASALLCGVISASAVDYLVQTGKEGDAVWTDAAINTIKTKGSPNVKVISFDTVKIANLPTTGEFWFAAGTYDFTESYDMKANTKLIGGFAGTETYATAPQKQNNKPYDYVNPTILNVVQSSETSTIRLFKNNEGLTGVVLTGLTIQNSKQTGNGGVYKPVKGNQIKYCTFKNNSATGQGGALLLYNQEVTIEGCLFEGNTAQQGGAIYCAGNNNKELRNCDFIGNYISGNKTGTHTGGAIYKQNDGNLTVSGCYFKANNSPNNGSTIALTGLNTTLVNNVVYDSKTKIAIYIYNLANVKIYHNSIIENEQGGLYTSSSKQGAVSIDLKNNVFWGTTATTGKCAVANAKGFMGNNAFVQNMSGSDTLAIADNIKLELTNTGNEGKLYPVFADPENGDFNIGEGSALIGEGVAIDGITTDIEGVTRTSLDLGAYAYVEGKVPTAFENTEKAPLDIQAALQAGEVYNLLGQRVGELQAGNIYIVGGQKVLMQ